MTAAAMGRRLAAVGLGAGLLAGCASTPLQTDGQVTTEDVMRRVKAELSQYYVYEHDHANDPGLANACSGRIDFKIKSVTVTLNAQSDETADVNASATLPVGAAGTLGPSVDVSGERKSTVTTKYTFYPIEPGRDVAPAPPEPDPKWAGFPIAKSIEQLRESLLKVSDTRPCVRFVAPETDGKPGALADQTVTFDFNVVHTAKGGAAFKFVLFSVGATGSKQVASGNNVAVTFNATRESMGLRP